MKIFVTYLAAFVVWLLLTWSLDPQEVLAGLAVAALSTYLTRDILVELPPSRPFHPKRYIWFLYYIPVFFWHMLRANLDVAYRVLHPEVPIRPGIVKVRTNLKREISKTMLANSITLTPGTLTVDVVGDFLYVHWINVSTHDPEEQTRIIVSRFERILKEVFE
ncbi:MAG TPA: Na+/H+ antiporter subunit E [Candidatus Latescibacteria bacterium]|nr:Na+/H+ antiporter subunit E [Candidatus Latescibacterota bacterium]